MEFDIKNNLLKTSIGENRLGQKNVKTAIDESLVASTTQKNLDMSPEQKQEEKVQKEKDKKNKKRNLVADSSDPKKAQSKEEQKIVRDPLTLLKLL